MMVLLNACTFNKNDNERNILAIEYKKDVSFSWSSLLQITEVIPLETNDTCIVSYANKCLVNDRYIVYDDYKQKALFVFNHEGKFLYKIDALGSGDKDYSIIKDVTFSHNQQEILLLDNTSILAYDVSNGKYKHRISLDKQLASFFYRLADMDHNNLYFWSTDSEYSLYRKDSCGITPIKEREGFPFVCQKFYQDESGNLNLISDCGKYAIESIIGNERQFKYGFDFGSLGFPDKKIKTATEWEKIDKQPYFKSLLSAFETKDALYVTTATPEKNLYNIVVNKATSEVHCGNQDNQNPIVVIGSDKAYFYGLLYPALFSKDSQFIDFMQQYKVSDEDNPVIIKFKFNLP